MAHGYYAAGGRPAAVMVHVNVGTGNAANAIINAARGILTVIFNNEQWEAVKFGALTVHPAGVAKTRGRFPLSELRPSPRFEEMARTVDGYGVTE